MEKMDPDSGHNFFKIFRFFEQKKNFQVNFILLFAYFNEPFSDKKNLIISLLVQFRFDF